MKVLKKLGLNPDMGGGGGGGGGGRGCCISIQRPTHLCRLHCCCQSGASTPV